MDWEILQHSKEWIPPYTESQGTQRLQVEPHPTLQEMKALFPKGMPLLWAWLAGEQAADQKLRIPVSTFLPPKKQASCSFCTFAAAANPSVRPDHIHPVYLTLEWKIISLIAQSVYKVSQVIFSMFSLSTNPSKRQAEQSTRSQSPQ